MLIARGMPRRVMSAPWLCRAGALLVISLATATSSLAAAEKFDVRVGTLNRNYKVHVPASYRQGQPIPVVLVLHGAAINADIMAAFTGMSHKADEAGFLAVYPNGTGIANAMLAFNTGNFPPEVQQHLADDVAYFRALLDDLEQRYTVDRRRIYATGLSNGGMMCYRLAAELSDRIAAIAPVGGTLCLNRDQCQPVRPVPILHVHGLADWIVPYGGVDERAKKILSFVNFKSVDESIEIWCDLNGCDKEPVIEPLPDKHDDGTEVARWTYPPRQNKNGKLNDGEIVLYRIAGGGHVWPGHKVPLAFLGVSTEEIDVNDVIWEFFQRHTLPNPQP